MQPVPSLPFCSLLNTPCSKRCAYIRLSHLRPCVICNVFILCRIQVEAIASGVQPGLTMVVGPPGTGKTDTAVQIMTVLYHNCPGQRTLLITHSNQVRYELLCLRCVDGSSPCDKETMACEPFPSHSRHDTPHDAAWFSVSCRLRPEESLLCVAGRYLVRMDRGPSGMCWMSLECVLSGRKNGAGVSVVPHLTAVLVGLGCGGVRHWSGATSSGASPQSITTAPSRPHPASAVISLPALLVASCPVGLRTPHGLFCTSTIPVYPALCEPLLALLTPVCWSD